MFDALDEHIRCFQELHRGTWASEYRAEGQCRVASQAFDGYLALAGYALPHRIVEFWTEPVEGVEEGENHFANVIEVDGAGFVVDWTARQFGLNVSGEPPPYPTVEPIERYVVQFGWERWEGGHH